MVHGKLRERPYKQSDYTDFILVMRGSSPTARADSRALDSAYRHEPIMAWASLSPKPLALTRKSWPTLMRSWSESRPESPSTPNRRDAFANAPSTSLKLSGKSTVNSTSPYNSFVKPVTAHEVRPGLCRCAEVGATGNPRQQGQAAPR